MATRLALGATPASVFWLVMKQGGMLALVGTAIGLVVAYLSGRIVASRIYAIRASDPLMLGAAIVLVVAHHRAGDDDSGVARVAPAAVGRAARGVVASCSRRAIFGHAEAAGAPREMVSYLGEGRPPPRSHHHRSRVCGKLRCQSRARTVVRSAPARR